MDFLKSMSAIDYQIYESQIFEHLGHLTDAEKLLLDILPEIEKTNDSQKIGFIHINLGTIAKKQGEFEKAILYYQIAIDKLTGLKGESYVQCAYANFNIATVYFSIANKKALPYSLTCLDMFKTYPLSSKADIIDATILVSISKLICNAEIDHEDLLKTWDQIKGIEIDNLYFQNLFSFITAIGLLKRDNRFKNILNEIQIWGGQTLINLIKENITPP